MSVFRAIILLVLLGSVSSCMQKQEVMRKRSPEGAFSVQPAIEEGEAVPVLPEDKTVEEIEELSTNEVGETESQEEATEEEVVLSNLSLFQETDEVAEVVPGFSSGGSLILSNQNGKSWAFNTSELSYSRAVVSKIEEDIEQYGFSDETIWKISSGSIVRVVAGEGEDAEPVMVTVPFEGENQAILGNANVKTIGVSDAYVLRVSASELHLYSYEDLRITVRVIKLPGGFNSLEERPLRGASLKGQVGYWLWGEAGFLFLVPLEEGGPEVWIKKEKDLPRKDLKPKLIYASVSLNDDGGVVLDNPILLDVDGSPRSIQKFLSPEEKNADKIEGEFLSLANDNCVSCHEDATKKSYWISVKMDAIEQISTGEMPEDKTLSDQAKADFIGYINGIDSE